ncbi:hypothetical protein [Deinococcus peraridilitoris]|uniref:Uncharacterized protein n=1 Tax=Deinococcus peraridilitoris (strain DSM 19664 / LMG 22246 / CIP 109416 / KR-200) TaxID=937777 RepID=L0A1T2_DEIPD|nr:hypothetical protein [Deinococcus peraridilitoris]AFZ67102.1 hypothetical protein Deipe_1561 [Deinococcus peraridilitoris DSM 19664]
MKHFALVIYEGSAPRKLVLRVLADGKHELRSLRGLPLGAVLYLLNPYALKQETPVTLRPWWRGFRLTPAIRVEQDDKVRQVAR